MQSRNPSWLGHAETGVKITCTGVSMLDARYSLFFGWATENKEVEKEYTITNSKEKGLGVSYARSP